jgi:magnesium transporter
MEMRYNKKNVVPGYPGIGQDFRFSYFSELLKRPVVTGKIKDRIGKLADLVFRLSETYPEAVGLYLEHGWGKPTEYIPWDKVIKIEDDAIFVQPPPEGEQYPPFVDQVGWVMLNRHLMGRTILDMDGRRIEVVNDVHLLESRGRMIIVHVDISFNGFLRRLGFRKGRWLKERLISWKYVQPLSVEDAAATDVVSLSITRKSVMDLPSEDLADALEELSGDEQEAFFSALDRESAADALVEAEPRVQRQLIASLRNERAKAILSELSIAQLADLFTVLPRDQMVQLMALVPSEDAKRIRGILSEREQTASGLMSPEFITALLGDKVADVLKGIRASQREHDEISYIYITDSEKVLLGVVDIRELLLAADDTVMEHIMSSPVVEAESTDLREDLEEMFVKYHYRMIPVVEDNRIIGVAYYNHIMKGLVTRAKT